MIGIKIGTDFLELSPGIVFEMVRNSPFLNNDQVDGEYSLPVTIPYTDKNYRLLGYIGNHYKTHKKTTVAATLYGGPELSYIGSLVVDAFEKTNNNPSSLTISAIFVFGISGFFQQVKDKKLSDLALGGVRNFNWTTSSPYDSSNGFWQHVHYIAANPGDYSFLPIRNDGYGSYLGDDRKVIDSMNLLDMSSSGSPLNFFYSKNVASLCPCISVSYLIKQVLKENGWAWAGNVLDDVYFKKLYAQSFRSIRWARYSTGYSGLLGTIINVFPLSTIAVDLKEHVPPDYKIADFIIDIKNRYGISFIFNSTKRVCTVSFLKDIINKTPKDFTEYCLSQATVKFDKAERIISLTNTIDGNDSYPLIISSSNASYLTAVSALRNLVSPAGVDEGTLCFVFEENTWYQVTENGGAKSWQHAGDNIGSMVNAAETETINTGISTFAMKEQIYRYIGAFAYSGYFPICSQPGNWYGNKNVSPWSMRTLLHHGLQSDRDPSNGTSNVSFYPYGSAHTTNNFGSDLTGWSNVYERSFGAINNGIYQKLFKEWLNIYKNTDSRIFTFNLPEYLLYDLQWDDIIFNKNVRFIIKNIKYNIPYNNVVQLELLKMDA